MTIHLERDEKGGKELAEVLRLELSNHAKEFYISMKRGSGYADDCAKTFTTEYLEKNNLCELYEFAEREY